MCNGWSIMHGGCTATILDRLSEIRYFQTMLISWTFHPGIHSAASLPIPALLQSKEWKNSGVSSSFSTHFYLPALIGDRLVVIATTKAGGKRSVTVHGEVRVMPRKDDSPSGNSLIIRFYCIKIWSQKGLVASCTLVKMVPSAKL